MYSISSLSCGGGRARESATLSALGCETLLHLWNTALRLQPYVSATSSYIYDSTRLRDYKSAIALLTLFILIEILWLESSE
jgi:hypothetical protein